MDSQNHRSSPRQRQGFSSLVISPSINSKRVRRSPCSTGPGAFPSAPVEPMHLPPQAAFKTTPTHQSPKSRKRSTPLKSTFDTGASSGASSSMSANKCKTAKKERNNKKLGKKSGGSCASGGSATISFASSWEVVGVVASRTASSAIRGLSAPSPMLRPLPTPRGALPSMLALPSSLLLDMDTEFLLDEMILEGF